MNSFRVILALIGLIAAINADSIIWNVPNDFQLTSFNDILSKSNVKPVIVFKHAQFDLASFSRAASAYGSKKDGGQLKSLKKWMDASEGYTVSDETLSMQLLRYFDSTEYDPTSIPNADDVAILTVEVDDYEDLDIAERKANDVRRIFNGRQYVAILSTVSSHRQKRDDAYNTEAPSTVTGNFTYVASGDCLLYAENIYFVAKVKNTSQTGHCKITLPHIPSSVEETTCGNFSGSLRFHYNDEMTFDNPGCTSTGSLTDLTITFVFYQSNTTQWWYVDSVSIEASGPMVGPTGTLNAILYQQKNASDNAHSGAYQFVNANPWFAYACHDPPVVYASNDAVTWGTTEQTLTFGLAFKNLQVQPFKAPRVTSGSLLTDNVDDCVPFFNIYIWMFVLSMLFLASLVLCGMAMMGSLKTMDRFDDMKAKTITVNVQN